jgi:hypothetical protein
MSTTINASTTLGLQQTADTSGILKLQTASTDALTLDASQNATFVGYVNAPNTFGFKNRIINGAMVIDQRNAGAEVNPAVNGTYYLDRWCISSGAAGKLKIKQNAGAVATPSGFINYLGVTSLSAYSVGASEQFGVYQPIEGLNIADLNWGTANAQAITISFVVYSSLTGTFGGSIRNSSADRSYPFTYTISAANTWETKTVTIAGDTSGTWLKTNGVGMYVYFGLGVGSTLSGTAGSWAGTNYPSATGATSVVGTNGATFYITGVQLEKGSTATSFDYRPYGTELALCQRYFETSFEVGTAVAEAQVAPEMISSVFSGTTDARSQYVFFSTKKRATPTITLYRGLDSSTAGKWAVYSGAWNTLTTNNGSGVSVNGFFVALNKTSLGTTYYSYLTQGNWTASSEL